ncbi:MAG: hypothetical protein AAGD38_11690 [Acidobacteriota bacterium]
MAAAVSAQTTYTYVGDRYMFVFPPYTENERIVGWIELAEPLPADQPLTEVGSLITDLWFTDSVQTFTFADTVICRAEIETNGNGAIVQWWLTLREVVDPIPDTPQNSIDVISLGGATRDVGGTGPVSNGLCGGLGVTVFGTVEAPGEWRGGGPVVFSDGFESGTTVFWQVVR